MFPTNAKQIAEMDLDNLSSLPHRWFTIDVGGEKIKINKNRAIMCWLLWEPYRVYPNIEITPSMVFGNNELITSGHITKIISEMIFTIFDKYKGKLRDTELLETLLRLAYDTVNNTYNYIVTNLGAYINTMSYLDVIDIIEDENVSKINASLGQENEEKGAGIRRIQQEVLNYLHESDIVMKLDSKFINRVQRAIKANLAKKNQTLQLVTSIGYRNDINGTIIPSPITESFGSGLRKVSDCLKESRTATESLFLNKDGLRKVQYLNRKIQLNGGYTRDIVGEDCGTNRLLEIKYNERTSAGLIGKYVNMNGTETVITNDVLKNFKDGDTVSVRSPVYCFNKDPATVCYKCYGALAKQIPAHTNIGHTSAVVIGERNAQIVLSNKHYIGSAISAEVHLDDREKSYLKLGDWNSSIYISDAFLSKMKKYRITMTVPKDFINQEEELSEYHKNTNIFDVSSLDYVEFTIHDSDDKVLDTDIVYVSSINRKASFSKQALAYINQKRWVKGKASAYVFDLSEYGSKDPLFKLPSVLMSPLEYPAVLGNIYLGISKLKRYHDVNVVPLVRFNDDIDSAINYFYNFINASNSHGDVTNIIHCEILVKSLMCRDIDQSDYSMPAGMETGFIGKYDDIMRKRSLGPAMAFERHKDIFDDIEMYLKKNRPGTVPSHPLDQHLFK